MLPIRFLRSSGPMAPVVPTLLLALFASTLAPRTAAAAPPPRTAAEVTALAPAGAAILAGVVADPPPKRLSKDAHFVVSDEKRHDIFRDAIADRGGMLIGVGTDQVYLLAGWAKSEIVIPMDFDQVVVDLHKVYRLVFLASKTPDAFIGWWKKDQAAALTKLVKDGFSDAAEQKRMLEVLEISRKHVIAKLSLTRRLHDKTDVKSFLNDQAQYDFIVALVRAGRVSPVRGDLTASITMKALAAASQKLGVPVRVLYLSNAEKYFGYSDQFKANILALPTDAQSLVLRTAARGPIDGATNDGLYIYVTQTAADFRDWVEHATKLKNWDAVLKAKVRTKVHGLYTVAGLPVSGK